MIHELKTWPAPFDAVWSGTKRFEIRKADRPFAVGDVLRLCCFDPETETYDGREVLAAVTYMVPGGAWGLPPDLCVLSIAVEQRLPPSGTTTEGRKECGTCDGAGVVADGPALSKARFERCSDCDGKGRR